MPAAAARDGLFLTWFDEEVEGEQFLPRRGLAFVGLVSAVLCFADLDVLIEAVATTRLVAQFGAQALGLWLLRDAETRDAAAKGDGPETRDAAAKDDGFRLPAHPLPELVCVLGFAFIFCTTPNYVLHGGPPLLEAGIVVLLSGVAAFYGYERARTRGDGYALP